MSEVKRLQYDVLKLDNQLCFSLYAASRHITAQYGPLLKQLDITYTQYITLMVLWEERCVPVKTLGERLILDTGTLTPLLKKMAEKGLVTRTRSTEDERSVDIAITPKGDAMRDVALQFLPALVCGLGLPMEDLSKLREMVKKLYTTPPTDA